jgi:hypothetical protein
MERLKLCVYRPWRPYVQNSHKCINKQVIRGSSPNCVPGSSGSIVPGYRLDDRAIEVRSPARAKDFSSSLSVQTGSGVHPASCTMGTGGPFPGGKSAAAA